MALDFFTRRYTEGFHREPQRRGKRDKRRITRRYAEKNRRRTEKDCEAVIRREVYAKIEEEEEVFAFGFTLSIFFNKLNKPINPGLLTSKKRVF